MSRLGKKCTSMKLHSFLTTSIHQCCGINMYMVRLLGWVIISCFVVYRPWSEGTESTSKNQTLSGSLIPLSWRSEFYFRTLLWVCIELRLL